MHVTMLAGKVGLANGPPCVVCCRYLLQQSSSEEELLPLCRTFASLLDHMGLNPTPELRDMKLKVSSGTYCSVLVWCTCVALMPCN